MQSYTIGQAARLLGVSPDTARRWADAGRVATHRDEGGRRLIDGKDLAAFSVELAKGGDSEEDVSYTSVRNAFPGIVTAVKLGDVAAQVEIQAGPHRLVSLLTREGESGGSSAVPRPATASAASSPTRSGQMCRRRWRSRPDRFGWCRWSATSRPRS